MESPKRTGSQHGGTDGTSDGTSDTYLPVVLPTPADGRDMQCSDGSRYVDETETARKYSLKSGLKTGQNRP
jgi:hypothetical protein